MKSRVMLSIVSMLMVGVLAIPVMAQNQPVPPNPRGDGERGGFGGGGGGGFGGRGGGRGGFDGQDGGRGGGRGPGFDIAKYEALRAYIDVVDRYSKLSEDPQSAAVAAVISAADLLRQRGSDTAIQFFAQILPDVTPAVERAIRIQLADLYKQSNQPQKALEQYELLMRSVNKAPAPTTNPSTPAPRP